MLIGVQLPQAGDPASREALIEVAQGAEQAGLASVWVLDRMLRPTSGAIPFAGYRLVYSPLETLAFVAALTSRVRLGTSVLVTPFSAPAMLARRIATVDQLCEGRLVVGLGQGYAREEFIAAGVPFEHRGARFGEYVAVLRACWAEDPVSHDGELYTVPPSEIGPKPVTQQGPPLMAGAGTEAAAARAARLGLGLNYVIFNLVADEWAKTEAVIGAHRRAAAEAGFDPDTLPSIVRANTTVGPAWTRLRRPPLAGSIEQVTEDLQRLAALGVRETFFDMYPGGIGTKAHLETLTALQEALR